MVVEYIRYLVPGDRAAELQRPTGAPSRFSMPTHTASATKWQEGWRNLSTSSYGSSGTPWRVTSRAFAQAPGSASSLPP
jgi:hypothetical protein